MIDLSDLFNTDPVVRAKVKAAMEADEALDLPPTPSPMEAGYDPDQAPRWTPRHRAEWWQSNDAEREFSDMPVYDSMADRARWIAEQAGIAALASLNADRAETPLYDHDSPVFPSLFGNRMTSLANILAGIDRAEMDAMMSRSAP